MRTPELRQAITAGFLEQKDSGDARSPFQRFKRTELFSTRKIDDKNLKRLNVLNAKKNAGARQRIKDSQDTQSLTPDAAQLICLQSLMQAIIAILIATGESV